jgi:hypothetical protein
VSLWASSPTFGGPSNNVDGLGVLGQGGEVFDPPVLPIFLYLPELRHC